jgi:hypothetical protein
MEIKNMDIKEFWERMRFYDMAKSFGFEKYINKEVKKVKKEIDYEKIKYFDLKVVKVKGKKKCEHKEVYSEEGKFKCVNCGRELTTECFESRDGIGIWKWVVKKNEKQANFVNGENLDKIKFPCWCSFEDGNGIKLYGEMDYIPNNYGGGEYYRIRVLKQVKDYKKDIFCYSATSKNLEELIETFKVKILKGKVVLFEKEEGE